jgi:hypothetical protein
MLAYLQGYLAPGDGGQGPFYWNESSLGPDNGTTVIVPNGVTLGAWIRLVASSTAAATVYPLAFEFLGGPPTANEIMGIEVFAQDVTFGADWAGAWAYCNSNPTSTFVITVSKNGSTVGTITFSTSGVPTFATSGNVAISFTNRDVMLLTAQTATDATFSNVGIKLPGTT